MQAGAADTPRLVCVYDSRAIFFRAEAMDMRREVIIFA